MRRINVSLDTMDGELFAAAFTPRTGWRRCCAGSPRPSDAGLKVKLNTVALKGLNEEEIPFLVEWAHATATTSP